MSIDILQDLLERRHQTSLRRLGLPGPSSAEIGAMLASAGMAPDHARILPWRLIVFTDVGRERLASAFEAALLQREPKATMEKIASIRAKAYGAPFLALAILRLKDLAKDITPLERAISLGAALQNMLLYSAASGYGAGLASGSTLQSYNFRRELSITEDEEAICFIGVGTIKIDKPPRERPNADRYVVHI